MAWFGQWLGSKRVRLTLAARSDTHSSSVVVRMPMTCDLLLQGLASANHGLDDQRRVVPRAVHVPAAVVDSHAGAAVAGPRSSTDWR